MRDARRPRIGIVGSCAIVAGLVCTVGVAAALSAEPGPPAPPSWVNPDGTVDESKMPDKLEVVGPDGELERDANGRPVMVDLKDMPDMPGTGGNTASPVPGQ